MSEYFASWRVTSVREKFCLERENLDRVRHGVAELTTFQNVTTLYLHVNYKVSGFRAVSFKNP